MRLLILGGTHFVGRALVEAALGRGHDVTTLNRGRTGTAVPGADARHADRRDPEAVRAALGADTWDAVLDTWSAEPVVVRDTARLVADRAEHYGYVSSRSVYQWPIPVGLDESAPVVDGDPGDTTADDYPRAKRGGELAVEEAFGGRALLARAGLILGPYEDVGRLPWWLRRLQRGGQVLAPGPQSRPLQLIDCRDLAAWMLDVAERRIVGAFNAVSQPGHATMGSLLDAANEVTGGRAELVWVEPEAVLDAGIQPWTELPVWTPPTGELAGLHAGDVSRAHAAGLSCRPVEETVRDTWTWLLEERDAGQHPRRAVGLDPAREQEVLAAVLAG